MLYATTIMRGSATSTMGPPQLRLGSLRSKLFGAPALLNGWGMVQTGRNRLLADQAGWCGGRANFRIAPPSSHGGTLRLATILRVSSGPRWDMSSTNMPLPTRERFSWIRREACKFPD